MQSPLPTEGYGWAWGGNQGLGDVTASPTCVSVWVGGCVGGVGGSGGGGGGGVSEGMRERRTRRDGIIIILVYRRPIVLIGPFI